MKLRTPFTVVANPLRDIGHIHDFSYKLPNEKRGDFWENECKLHPTKSTCKLYEVQTGFSVDIQEVCIQKLCMSVLDKSLEQMLLLTMQAKERVLLLLIYWLQLQGLVSLR